MADNLTGKEPKMLCSALHELHWLLLLEQHSHVYNRSGEVIAGIGLTLAPAQQSDGFLCTPYYDGNPAAATIYCAYLDNSSIKWVTLGSVSSQGESKTFYDGTSTLIPPDLHIPYYKTYKFCAWNGTYRSEWTTQVYYVPNVHYPYELDMTIYCPMAPDPNEEE